MGTGDTLTISGTGLCKFTGVLGLFTGLFTGLFIEWKLCILVRSLPCLKQLLNKYARSFREDII